MKKRERFLLILLAAMIILLGGYKFLIEPQLAALASAKDELDLAQIEKQQAEENVRRAGEVARQNIELEEKIAEESGNFFPELENDKIHIFFDEIFSSVNLSYASLGMGARAVATITPFKPVDNSIFYPLKDSAASINIMNEREEVKDSSSSDNEENDTELEKMIVSLQFNASYNQMKAFIDAIKNSERTVRIVSISTAGSDADLSVSMSAECFGLKKITDDPLAENSLPAPSGRSSPF